MPASIIVPCAGPRTVVKGIKIAIAGVGPTPGIIPAREHMRAPSIAMVRFIGASALPKPDISMLMVSTFDGSPLVEADDATGQRNIEQIHKKVSKRCRQHDRVEKALDPAVPAHEDEQRDCHDKRANHVPDPVHQVPITEEYTGRST